MILKAFRIKNYRSIIDTGWNNLSLDNVTALIGQNESGKTSVLEALKSFYDGYISDDILRSDLSMPEVSCTFLIEKEEEYPGEDISMPEGVIERIRETGYLTLTRTWIDLQNSKLLLNGDDIINLYGAFDNFWPRLEQETNDIHRKFSEKSKVLRDKADSLDQLLSKYKTSLEVIMRKTGELDRQLRKTSDNSRKEQLEKEIGLIAAEVNRLEQQMEKTGNELKTIREELNNANQVLNISSSCVEFHDRVMAAREKLDYGHREMLNAEKKLENSGKPREQKNASKKLEQYKNLYVQLMSNFYNLRRDYNLAQLELKFLLEGKDEFESKRFAEEEFTRLDRMLSREDAAQIFVEHIPHFELFEDFSSLLPNRIDLEDLFLEHINAEGYKAVKNFLVIAGLEPEFFTQMNNRILKQKIENLNNELTIDFQDYWGQCIGKTNKIQIAFELEHYDFQNPVKKGKPYLEFWIKDEQERLYPKQRSRGVRWFLSFYLELKASARKHSGKNRILLIDEPALSLHARAQEDVLKVFEDIRDKLQVIYTTHSPHLIDLTKLFRVLAVQRSHEVENGETIIFEPALLHTAAQDTLSPIYSLMGVRLSEHEFIRQRNNILVENATTYYYLSAMLPLAGLKSEVSFLPASGSQSIHLLSNLMLGWGLEYHILLFDNAQDRSYTNELEKSLAVGREGNGGKTLHIENAAMVEDLFSTLDFKNHIIKQRVGIPEKNSEYLIENNLSRVMLASSFAQLVKSEHLRFSDFDEETKSNFRKLAKNLNALLS
jgi:predicted ATP-dependent endonuclease of OLD family